jgi:hypothetical protein
MSAPLLPARIPPDWGGPLTEGDYIGLASSWITREIADAAMLRRVDAQTGREVVGQKGSRDCAGILIPYYWPDEPRPFNYRLRRDNPDLNMMARAIRSRTRNIWGHQRAPIDSTFRQESRWISSATCRFH